MCFIPAFRSVDRENVQQQPMTSSAAAATAAAPPAPIVVLAAKSKPPPRPPPVQEDTIEAAEAVQCSSKHLLATSTNESCDNGENFDGDDDVPVTVIPLPSIQYTDHPHPNLDMLTAGDDSGNAMENFEDEIAPMVVRPSKQPPRLENLEAIGQAFMPTKVVNVLCPHCRGKMSVEELKAHMPTCQGPLPLASAPTPPPPTAVLSPAVAAPVIAAAAASAATSTMASGIGAAPNPNFVCNVCNKECPSENELALHKKRHKLDSPLICEYCNQTYTNRHRYEVHVRFHTGETPFKCHICGKGFRDDRKMRLHVARHDGSLPNKCDLCPRSFEGPKALEKHKEAHRMGRFVQPKVIMNADGSMAMALPTEAGAGGPGIGTSTVVPPTSANAAAQLDSSLTTPVIGTEGQMNLALAGLQPIPPAAAAAVAAANAAQAANNADPGSHDQDDQATISLSMDDLMQYAQPVPDNVIHEENGLEDKLTAGRTKFVPLNMDEFTGGGGLSVGAGTTGSMLLSSKVSDCCLFIYYYLFMDF